MRITRIETLQADGGGWRRFCFVKLSTDEGLVGWSEYCESHWSRGLSALIAELGASVTTDAGALAQVRAAAGTPIASLESLHGRRAYRPFLERGAVDVAIVDVPWNGFLEAVKIAALAEAHELNVAPHNFCGHLATMINAQFAAAVPNLRVLEIEADDVPWRDELYTAVPWVEHGELLVGDAPGWGIEVNEEAVRARPPR